MKALARIHFGEESISLGFGGIWTASSAVVEPLARMATMLSQPPFYEYSPSDGGYGGLLAAQVVRKLGGRQELPEREEGPEPVGVVF